MAFWVLGHLGKKSKRAFVQIVQKETQIKFELQIQQKIETVRLLVRLLNNIIANFFLEKFC